MKVCSKLFLFFYYNFSFILEYDNDHDEMPNNVMALTARDGEVWSETPITSNIRKLSNFNILRERPGPVNKNFATPGEVFKSFFTDNVIKFIVQFTNEEAKRHNFNWIDTTVQEIQTYIGLLLLAGVYRSRFEPIQNLWSTALGRPIFGQAMRRDRFLALTRFLRFDSKDDRVERRQRDKLAPIRTICDIIQLKFRANFKAGASVCVDEQLLAFRGRVPFKIYIPSKPCKYGIKIWILCDCDTSYCLNFQIYVGKEGRFPEVNQGSRVILELTEFMKNSGRNCTMDNFFSSLSLSKSLLARQMTMIGTVRKNKTFLPTAITCTQMLYYANTSNKTV